MFTMVSVANTEAGMLNVGRSVTAAVESVEGGAGMNGAIGTGLGGNLWPLR